MERACANLNFVEGVVRAVSDLAQGDARKARERLKSLVAAAPADRRIRSLLAEAYRRDGQPTEAGRWGYLDGPAASHHERTAFERHCGFGDASRITERRLRHLLRVDALDSIADAHGRALLRVLPRKRRPDRRDGLSAGAARLLASFRAQLRYRH